MHDAPPLSRLQRQRLADVRLAAERKLARAEATQRRIAREARRVALSEAALVLRREGLTYREIAGCLGVSFDSCWLLVAQAGRRANNPPWPELLPQRVKHFLGNHGLAELPELEAATRVAALTRRQLLATPNFGIIALAAAVGWLAKHGLTLAERDRSEQQEVIHALENEPPRGERGGPRRITAGES